MVAVRSPGPGFRETSYDTVPLPEPEPPDLTASHPAELVAIQTHPCDAVTENVPVPASSPNCARSGESEYAQGRASRPRCVTAWFWVAIVSVPFRSSVEVFSDTEYDTVPVPVAPALARVAQATFDAAVQAHVGPVVTVTVPLPPSRPNDWLGGAMTYEQTGAGATGEL
jgi:hypothetical protein